MAAAFGTVACGEEPGPGLDAPLRVRFLTDAAEHALVAEEAATLRWLRDQPDLEVEHLLIGEISPSRLPAGSILWWHHAASPTLPSSAMDDTVRAAVRGHLERGGGLLLTLFAASWVVPLGLETSGPEAEWIDGGDWARWGPDDRRILAGLQSFRGHPLLRRFWGGTYVATPIRGRRYPSARWQETRWPVQGRVAAVGRRAIGLDADRRIAVEYPPDASRRGRVLAIGEGLYFSDPGNGNRVHLELLTRDALDHLAGRLPPLPVGATIASTGAPALSPTPATTGPPGSSSDPVAEVEPAALPPVLADTTYWEPRASGTRRIEVAEPAPADRPADPGITAAVAAARSGLLLERAAEPTTAFDLYSPRVLALGRESGLIEEVWSHPVRLVEELRFGISDPDGGEVVWLHEQADAVAYTARPESRTFRYSLPDATVTVDLAVRRDRAGLVVLIRLEADGPRLVHAAWIPDAALMWPRPTDDPGVLEIGLSEEVGAALWRDADGTTTAYAGFDVVPLRAVVGGVAADPEGVESASDPDVAPADPEDEAPEPARAFELAVPIDPSVDPVRTFVVAAAPADGTDARALFDELRADPASVWTDNANYYSRFLAETLSIETPDSTFNEAFRWTKVGLDAFRVTTPGLGTGLAAGYAAARDPDLDAWAADNDFLRRPGYGWYFGRDAIWTALAADAYGGTDLTGEALRLLARYQDVDGKILHELTTSGSLHYDAADSTPLFLVGLDHHVRATGDRELLRALWPTVRRAMAFLETTDTDGDGFIENTGVGHGWIEGGALYGAHTTFYLASVWTAALEAVVRMAGWMSDGELGATAAERLAVVAAALETEFWDPEGRTYHYGKNADGSYKSARTILPAVPMTLGLLDPSRVRPLLDLFASAEITTDWGARMIGRSSAEYDPLGYHEGMVWPLYTGWTALAAYRHGRPLQGYLHASQNLRLVRQGNLGHLPEALNGELYRSVGVTSHQAWSQAMAILPVVEGMLGLRPDAIEQRLLMVPRLPGGWDEVTVQPVRVADGTFRVTVFRGVDASGFRIDRMAGGAGVQLDLALPFPRAVLVNLDRDATIGVTIPEGEEIVDSPSEKLARVLAAMTEDQAVITFAHSRFPTAIQPIPTPEPDAASRALRLLDSRFVADELRVRVEGIPGQGYTLSLDTPWAVREVSGPVDRVVVAPGPGRALLQLTLPGSVSGYQRAEIVVSFRR